MNLLPGEHEAIEKVKELGAIYGYGNLIMRLKDAWSDMLVEKSGFSREAADAGARHICPWCHVDQRTGEGK